MPTSTADARRRALTIRQAGLTCSITGCRYRRNGLSRHCSWHTTCVRKYGHAQGRQIQKQQYVSYVRLARKLFKRFEGHPALVAALDTMRTLLTPGEEPTGKPLRLNARWLLWRELQRLDDITPQAALAAVAGIWLYSYTHSRQLPDDNRLTYALANAVFRLRPLAVARSMWNHDTGKVEKETRPPGALAISLLGSRIRNELAPFLANITAWLEEDYRQASEKAFAMSQPFTMTAGGV